MSRTLSSPELKALVEALVFRIHAANHRDTDWNEVLELLREWLGACSAALGRHHFSTGQGGALYDAPRDPVFRASYAEYATRNPWFLSSADYTAGRVMTGEELI